MEQLHCLIKEVFVHRLPPRSGARAYKASDWDPNYLWKGRLRVVSVGKECMINLEDETTGALFAQSPYDSSTNSVESVSDSSRYFVLRVVDRDTKQHAFIGIGFTERTDAFDFNVALQEFEKGLRYDQATASPAPPSPVVDYSLKEGQTIRINLAGKTKVGGDSPAKSSTVSLPPAPHSAAFTSASDLDDVFAPQPGASDADPFGAPAPAGGQPSASGFDDAFGDSFENAFLQSHPEASNWDLTTSPKDGDEAWTTFK